MSIFGLWFLVTKEKPGPRYLYFTSSIILFFLFLYFLLANLPLWWKWFLPIYQIHWFLMTFPLLSCWWLDIQDGGDIIHILKLTNEFWQLQKLAVALTVPQYQSAAMHPDMWGLSRVPILNECYLHVIYFPNSPCLFNMHKHKLTCPLSPRVYLDAISPKYLSLGSYFRLGLSDSC